jgi:arylsulfatase A-like enzyme
MDWFPTVLDLCGIQQEPDAPKLDGRSMTRVIADPWAAGAHEVLHFAWANNWAVRRGDWKLIHQPDNKSKAMNLSLHNLAEPAPEVKDHAKERPEIVKELTTLHEAWQKDLDSK